MDGQPAADALIPREMVEGMRGRALSDARGNRFASTLWTAIWAAGMLAYVVAILAGAAHGVRDPAASLTVFGLLLLIVLVGIASQARRDVRMLSTITTTEPRQLTLRLEPAGTGRGLRLVRLLDGSRTVGTARVKQVTDRSPQPGPVLVFGRLAHGERITCVSPERAVARYRLDPAPKRDRPSDT